MNSNNEIYKKKYLKYKKKYLLLQQGGISLSSFNLKLDPIKELGFCNNDNKCIELNSKQNCFMTAFSTDRRTKCIENIRDNAWKTFTKFKLDIFYKNQQKIISDIKKMSASILSGQNPYLDITMIDVQDLYKKIIDYTKTKHFNFLQTKI